MAMGRVHANRVGVAVVQARRAQLRLLLLLDGLLVLVLLLLLVIEGVTIRRIAAGIPAQGRLTLLRVCRLAVRGLAAAVVV